MVTNSVTPSNSSGSVQAAASSATNLNSKDFLTLLVSQVQNQDPLDPMTNAQFASQLAQFSTLQGIQQLNTNFSTMLQLQTLTQGANLIGRTVVYQPSATSANTLEGNVDAVNIQNGQLQAQIGGSGVPLGQIQGIVQSSATTPTGQ